MIASHNIVRNISVLLTIFLIMILDYIRIMMRDL